MAKPERSRTPGVAGPAPEPCARCGTPLDAVRTCPACRYHAPLTAWQRIEQLVDPRSFHETDHFLWSGDPLGFSDSQSYERRIAQAQAATHLLDAVVIGRARLCKVDVVLIVFDFRFLGGQHGQRRR